jgi:hypothetical protein
MQTGDRFGCNLHIQHLLVNVSGTPDYTNYTRWTDTNTGRQFGFAGCLAYIWTRDYGGPTKDRWLGAVPNPEHSLVTLNMPYANSKNEA